MTLVEFRNRRYILGVLPPDQQGIVRRAQDYGTSAHIFQNVAPGNAGDYMRTAIKMAKIAFPELSGEEN